MHIRFDPDKEGLEAFLGPLQCEILAYLWIPGILPCTNKKIQRELRCRGCDRELPTIATTTRRMALAGILNECRGRSGAYVYEAAMTREGLVDQVITRLMHRLLLDWPDLLETYVECSTQQQQL